MSKKEIIVPRCQKCKEKCWDLKTGNQCEIYQAHNTGYQLGVKQQQKYFEKKYKLAIQLEQTIKEISNEHK